MGGEVSAVGLPLSSQAKAEAEQRDSVTGSSLLLPSVSRPPSLPEPDPNAKALRAYASRIELCFGTMMDSMKGNGWETAWVRETLGAEFNFMEPGTQFKWATIHPAKDTFDFAPGDALVDFAVAHNMKVRGHTLLWGMANPDWLGNQGSSRLYQIHRGRVGVHTRQPHPYGDGALP